MSGLVNALHRKFQNRKVVSSYAILLGTPETVMHHSQGAGGPFIIMCKTFGKEEFHDCRTGGGLHPDERRKAISMHSHHDLFQ